MHARFSVIQALGDPSSPSGKPQPNVPERKSHPRGKPLQPRFLKYSELFEEPHHRRAADDSLTAAVKPQARGTSSQ
jgi:hypothetical protein